MSTTQTGTETPGVTPRESLVEHRIAMFEELGFSKEEAELLHASFIDVKIGDKMYKNRLSHHDIRKHMSQGCTAELILKIFT